LAFAVLLTPELHAGERCMQLTNFCDTIVFNASGSVAYGNWDWECSGDWKTTSVIGNAKGALDLATRPVNTEADLPGNFGFQYSTEFLFKPGKVFDLYGASETVILPFQTDQPFTVRSGSCGFNDVDTSKPRLMSQLSQHREAPPAKPQSGQCLRFTNFCDSIEFFTSGKLLYGGWDWQCEGDYSDSSVIGNVAPRPQLTTRPIYPLDYPYAYTTEFSFQTGKLFDLYLTSGVLGGVLVARKDQPYTLTSGSCAEGDRANQNKPRMLAP